MSLIIQQSISHSHECDSSRICDVNSLLHKWCRVRDVSIQIARIDKLRIENSAYVQIVDDLVMLIGIETHVTVVV